MAAGFGGTILPQGAVGAEIIVFLGGDSGYLAGGHGLFSCFFLGAASCLIHCPSSLAQVPTFSPEANVLLAVPWYEWTWDVIILWGQLTWTFKIYFCLFVF